MSTAKARILAKAEQVVGEYSVYLGNITYLVL